MPDPQPADTNSKPSDPDSNSKLIEEGPAGIDGDSHVSSDPDPNVGSNVIQPPSGSGLVTNSVSLEILFEPPNLFITSARFLPLSRATGSLRST